MNTAINGITVVLIHGSTLLNGHWMLKWGNFFYNRVKRTWVEQSSASWFETQFAARKFAESNNIKLSN